MDWAYAVGLRRSAANHGKADAPHYDAAYMEDNDRASIAAACCEVAVARATSCYWDGAVWDSSRHHSLRGRPDVYPGIEVRRVREFAKPMVVRARDVREHRTVVCAFAKGPMYREVTVLGWLPADEAWALGEPTTYDPDRSRWVDQAHLRPIERLRARG